MECGSILSNVEIKRLVNEDNSREYEIIATTAFGLEAVVVRELADLGYPDTRVEDGRVRFRAPLSAICRTNIWLRCAERIQLVVGEFPAKDFDDLFDNTKILPWEEWLQVDAKFPVTANCVRSEINSPMNVQRMVKRAIVERMRKVYTRHQFAEDGIHYPVDVDILKDKVLMTLDTSGDGLHKRGYRLYVGQAPLRETVAAALVLLSYWRGERLLVDPFCGSGTIPIEAAMIGRNLAPGRDRSFESENWPQIPVQHWTDARQEARDLVKPPLPVQIMARDQDPKMVKIAKQNSSEAGVFSEITFAAKDFVAFPTNRDHGCTVCNPPYGERIGQRDEVSQLHSDMGELLIPLDTWSHYIFTGAENFEREFGKYADRRRKIFNARIPCTDYQYLGPKPPEWDQREDESVNDDANSETQPAE
ncbi:MAG: class I SAM-dependent RNA methyltransferase [Planctomicrobium sp.]|jgi:putative N6-adenine-specific DNA methylase|nr:class I SAM-dependent RNA methyltransferase [Planctomicrobium sp.]